MFKFIFDLITEPLGLPIEWYYEWIILLVIGEMAYRVAYNKVGVLYQSGSISGKSAGSFFHWIIRTVVFVAIWAVTYGVIWIGKFVMAHKIQVAIGICSIVAVVIAVEDHLRKTGSKLAKQVRERGVEEILNDMQLLIGPPELRYIQNVAIMMFCEHPEKFFGYTYVQMTSFPKGSIENPSISEDFPNITGSVPQMIQATMERFRNLIIREKVIKVPNQMEALRIFNYPYQAIEEAVVNAFYHRDYMSFEPVTIEIEPDCINIMNFPGIDRSISEKTIAEGKRFVSRYYRNRRLGEFLKELDLSEGHSSGIPTIQEELEKNGSPRAEFFTDEDRRAMRIRIPIHPAFLEADDEVLLPDSYEKATKKSSKKKIEQYEKILKLLNDGEWHKTAEIAENLGLKDTRTKELLKELIVLDKLIDNGKTKGKLYRLK